MVKRKSEVPEAQYTHFIDWGNDSIKFQVTGSVPLAIRSLYFTAPAYYGLADFHEGSLVSPIIEKDGHRVHWGEAARLYPQYAASVREDKLAALKAGLWAAIGPVGELTEYSTRLVLSVPHMKRFKQMYPNFVQEVVGTHEFYHNDQRMAVTITEARVIPESYGSYLDAKATGLTGSKMTLVIDIGCGTTLYGLYQPSGVPVDIVCKEHSGVIKLVNMLRVDPALVQRVGDTPQPEAIQDGLRDMSFTYGALGISFGDMAQALGPQWWRGLISDALTTYHGYRTQIDRVLLTGGGAHLARAFGYPQTILEAPEWANLRGMTSL